MILPVHFLVSLVLTAFASTSPQVINVTVDETGFTPAEITAPVGSTVELHLTRTTDDTCATAVVVPAFKIEKKLPLNQMVSVTLKGLKKGQIKFGCQMKMMLSGVILVN